MTPKQRAARAFDMGPGTRVRRIRGTRIAVACMSPSYADCLDRIMSEWATHKATLPKRIGDKRYVPGIYAFAYWLIRWSGLVEPAQAGTAKDARTFEAGFAAGKRWGKSPLAMAAAFEAGARWFRQTMWLGGSTAPEWWLKRCRAEARRRYGKSPRCPECRSMPPGHKIGCKTGNAAAKDYQRTLSRRYGSKRRKP